MHAALGCSLATSFSALLPAARPPGGGAAAGDGRAIVGLAAPWPFNLLGITY